MVEVENATLLLSFEQSGPELFFSHLVILHICCCCRDDAAAVAWDGAAASNSCLWRGKICFFTSLTYKYCCFFLSVFWGLHDTSVDDEEDCGVTVTLTAVDVGTVGVETVDLTGSKFPLNGRTTAGTAVAAD